MAKMPTPLPVDPLARARLQQRVVSMVSSSALVHSGDVDGLARLLTDAVGRLLDIERVGVWLFNESKDELVCRDLFVLSRGSHEAGAVLRRAEFAEEFHYLVNEKYVDAHDPLTDPRTRGYVEGYLKPNRITAMLDAVVRIGEELIGTVCFEHVDRAHRWQDDEIVFASQLGDQLALTVSIARQRSVAAQLRLREAELCELNATLEQRVEERTESLHRTRVALMQAEELAALGRMVAGVAHELNTPVGNALLIATTLRERTREAASMLEMGTLSRSGLAAHFSETVEQSALVEHSLARAAALVDNFKQLALDQASQVRRRFDLREVVLQTTSALGPRLRRAGATLEVELPEGVIVDAYPGPLEQVIDNLVMNALVHGFAERTGGTVRVGARVVDAEVHLSVADDGHGVPLEIQSRIFDPFFTTRLGRGGSGIGLATVHGIVTRLFGGRIALSSVPGEGARFDIVFPSAAPEGPARDAR
jgi:signal transduction histidine kinase